VLASVSGQWCCGSQRSGESICAVA
jgi:hypothetical protein